MKQPSKNGLLTICIIKLIFLAPFFQACEIAKEKNSMSDIKKYFSEIEDTIHVEPGEIFEIESPSVPVMPGYFNVTPFIEISNDIEEVINQDNNELEGSRSRTYRLKADRDIETAKLVIGVLDTESNDIFKDLTKTISIIKKE